jgi:hypothetical protein
MEHNSKYFITKFAEITAISADFITKAGLLHDPIFLTMTGHLGKFKKQFHKIPHKSREFNIQNQHLYFDSYFNINNSKQNFISKNYSDKFFKKVVTYFNDSCITDTSVTKNEWTKNIARHQYIVNREPLGLILDKYLFFNYGFFILEAPEHVQYRNAVIPNEMGRIYLTHYNITPQSFVITMLNSITHTIKNISQKTRSEYLKLFLKNIKHLNIKGITK